MLLENNIGFLTVMVLLSIFLNHLYAQRLERRLGWLETRLDHIEEDLSSFYRILGLHEEQMDHLKSLPTALPLGLPTSKK